MVKETPTNSLAFHTFRQPDRQTNRQNTGEVEGQFVQPSMAFPQKSIIGRITRGERVGPAPPNATTLPPPHVQYGFLIFDRCSRGERASEPASWACRMRQKAFTPRADPLLRSSIRGEGSFFVSFVQIPAQPPTQGKQLSYAVSHPVIQAAC